MALIDCLTRSSIPEKDKKDIESLAKEFRSSKMSEKDSFIMAIREHQDMVLDDLHDTYHKLGIEGFEKPISSIKKEQYEKITQQESRESGEIKSRKEGEQQNAGEKNEAGVLKTSPEGEGVGRETTPSLKEEKKEPFKKQIEKSTQRMAKAKEEGMSEKVEQEKSVKKQAQDNINLIDKFGLSSNELITKLRNDGRLQTLNCA